MLRRFSTWVNSPRVTGWFFVVTSVGCAIAAVVTYSEATALRRNGERTTGRIVAVHPGRSSYVTAEFETPAGEPVVADVHQYYWRPTPQVGDAASLLYDPNDPSGNVVDTRMGPDFLTVWFAVGGSAVAAVASLLTFRRKIDWRRMSPWTGD